MGGAQVNTKYLLSLHDVFIGKSARLTLASLSKIEI